MVFEVIVDYLRYTWCTKLRDVHCLEALFELYQMNYRMKDSGENVCTY